MLEAFAPTQMNEEQSQARIKELMRINRYIANISIGRNIKISRLERQLDAATMLRLPTRRWDQNEGETTRDRETLTTSSIKTTGGIEDPITID